MNRTFPIILIVIAVIVLTFVIITQTPVSKHIPLVNQQDTSSSDKKDSQSTISNNIPVNTQSYPSSSSSGGSGGTNSPVNENSSSDSKAPNYCTSDSRVIENCDSTDPHIVCGWYSTDVSCSIGPCVRMFGNECEACRDQSIEYWTEGECPIHG